MDGVTVEYRRPDGSIAGAQARVLDFQNPESNDWLAVNQFTVVQEQRSRRPDIVIFVNGLPLAVLVGHLPPSWPLWFPLTRRERMSMVTAYDPLELKNAASEDATVWTDFQQLQTYQDQIPSLFAYNAVIVASDGVQARIGALGAGREWFKP